MHIVFYHHQKLPVPKYGGIERLIVWLMKDLRRLGHKVTLLGHPKSDFSNFGITTIAANSENWQNLIPADADLVHLFFAFFGQLKVPHICYIAGNAKPGESFPINTVFASQSHAQNHQSQCFVHHGIDFDDYPQTPKISRSDGWNKFSFLAKASWKIKNLKDCIRAVNHSRKELFIGGGWRLSLNRRIHWLGMLNDKQSVGMFDLCDGFLWPVLWPEPFGLAPIVAMSRGIPVISSIHGSSPELITNKGVGTLCKNYTEFEDAIAHRGNYLPAKQIRSYAMDTFPIRKMTLAFIDKYHEILDGKNLNPHNPKSQLLIAADKNLLQF